MVILKKTYLLSVALLLCNMSHAMHNEASSSERSEISITEENGVYLATLNGKTGRLDTKKNTFSVSVWPGKDARPGTDQYLKFLTGENLRVIAFAFTQEAKPNFQHRDDRNDSDIDKLLDALRSKAYQG